MDETDWRLSESRAYLGRERHKCGRSSSVLLLLCVSDHDTAKEEKEVAEQGLRLFISRPGCVFGVEKSRPSKFFHHVFSILDTKKLELIAQVIERCIDWCT